MIMTSYLNPILNPYTGLPPQGFRRLWKGKDGARSGRAAKVSFCHHKLTMYYVAPNTKRQVAKEN